MSRSESGVSLTEEQRERLGLLAIKHPPHTLAERSWARQFVQDGLLEHSVRLGWYLLTPKGREALR